MPKKQKTRKDRQDEIEKRYKALEIEFMRGRIIPAYGIFNMGMFPNLGETIDVEFFRKEDGPVEVSINGNEPMKLNYRDTLSLLTRAIPALKRQYNEEMAE